MKSSQTHRSVSPVKQLNHMDIRSKIEAMLTKSKGWKTPFGVLHKLSSLLQDLPGTSKVTYKDQDYYAIRIPFDVQIDASLAETRGEVYKQTRECISHLTSQGVPEQPVWKALRDLDSTNRIWLQYFEGIVRSYQATAIQDQKKHKQLDRFLRHPPALDPLSTKERAVLVQLVARQRKTLNATTLILFDAETLLSKARKNYTSKKSPHLAKIKGSLFKWIKENTGWSRNRTATEMTNLLSAWNTDLAGKDSSHRIASYRR